VHGLLTLEGEGEAGAVPASVAVFLEVEGQTELVSSAVARLTSIRKALRLDSSNIKVTGSQLCSGFGFRLKSRSSVLRSSLMVDDSWTCTSSTQVLSQLSWSLSRVTQGAEANV